MCFFSAVIRLQSGPEWGGGGGWWGVISVQERGWRWWRWGRGGLASKFEYNDIKSSRLSCSAVLLRQAFPFLSKAARHSSGFTKSSADETNPVASLCESCRQTTPPPPASRLVPSPSISSSSCTDVGGGGVGWGGGAGSRDAVRAAERLGTSFNLTQKHIKGRINLK